MFSKFKKQLKKISPFPVIIIAITVILALLNHQPGTWLLGWDNHPIEMNWWLYFERAWGSIWQGWSGLGMVGGMSYAADLPRVILLTPFVTILPGDLVRYGYTFFCLGFGALGVYKFCKDILFQKIQRVRLKEFAAFAGGLFYMFNLGTLQLFYATLEMFITAYAFIPWLLWAITSYLKSPSKKGLAILIVLSFFATPMAITPTVFINYAVIVAVIFIGHIINLKKQGTLKKSWRAIAFAALALIVTNLFWVLPSAYALATKPETVTTSRIGTLASPDIRDYAQEYATWQDYPIFKSFWFGQSDMVYEEGREPGWEPMLNVWIDYLDQPFITTIGYVLFAGSILGLAITIFNRKKFSHAYIPISAFLIGSFMLLGTSLPTGILFSFMRDNSSFLNEIFRLPFSKFVYITLFGYATLLAAFVYWLLAKLEHAKLFSDNFKGLLIATLVLVFPIMVYMAPAFRGDFIFSELKVKFPNEYQQLFDYFDEQSPDKRILHLPANTWAGWTYYDWGYRGSGFLWYGIEQPIVDRAFDVWSKENEGIYLELVTSLTSKDPVAFKTLAEKYAISFVLIDKNILDLGQGKPALLIPEAQELLTNTGFEKSAQFGDLEVYTAPETVPSIFEETNTITSVNETNNWTYEDTIHQRHGDYISTANPGYIYPFYSTQERSGVSFNEIDGVISLGSKINTTGNYLLNIPSLSESKFAQTQVLASMQGGNIILELLVDPPAIYLNNQKVTTQEGYRKVYTIPVTANPEYITVANQVINLVGINEIPQEFASIYVPTTGQFTISVFSENGLYDLTNQLAQAPVLTCGHEPRSSSIFRKESTSNSLSLIAQEANACVFTDVSPLFQNNQNYIVNFSYNVQSNLDFKDVRPEVCVRNAVTFECYNDLKLGFQSNNFYSNTFLMNKGEAGLSLDAFVRNIDTKTETIPAKIDYSNIRLNYYRELATIQGGLEDYKFNSVNLNLKSGDELAVEISTNTNLNSYQNFATQAVVRPEIFNCAVFPDTKLNVFQDMNAKHLQLEAENGASCLLFDYPTLPHYLDYIVRVKGKNVSGRQLRVNIDDPVLKAYQNVLDTSWVTESTDNYFIIRNTNSNTKGYQVNVRNNHISGERTVNQIEEIEVVPFYREAIQRINLSLQSINDKESKSIATDYLRQNSLNYLVKLTDYSGSNYLKFFTTFDKGWVAYQFEQEPSTLDQILPFINGKRLEGHAKLNNWANSWELKEDTGYVLVIFAPQALETGALVAMIVVIYLIYVVIIFTKVRREIR